MVKFSLLKKFWNGEHGYVALIFGIAALPAITIIGAAIDYRAATARRAELRAATEAGTIAVTRAWVTYNKEMSLGNSLPKPESNDIFNSTFEANININDSVAYRSPPGVNSISLDEALQRTTVMTSAAVRTNFLAMLGIVEIPIDAVAIAGPMYSDKNVDVQLMVDFSTSMGLPFGDGPVPLTPAPENCFLACHDKGVTTRSGGMTPRMDLVWDHLRNSTGTIQAIQNAVDTNQPVVTANFTLHGFDSTRHYLSGPSNGGTMQSYMDASGNGALGWTQIRSLSEDDTNEGTDYNESFASFLTYLNGVGLPPTKRRIIIIISDGMQANAKRPFDPASCTALKAKGDVYTLAVLGKREQYDNSNLDNPAFDIPSTHPDYGRTVSAGAPGKVRKSWNWETLLNGNSEAGSGDSSVTKSNGYYSGLNNAAALMKNCASKLEWAFSATTAAEVDDAFLALGRAVTEPAMRIMK